jgi:DNA-binding MarR family transcriptional regulator
MGNDHYNIPLLEYVSQNITGKQALLFIYLLNNREGDEDGWVHLTYSDMSAICLMLKSNTMTMAKRLLDEGIIEKRIVNKRRNLWRLSPSIRDQYRYRK